MMFLLCECDGDVFVIVDVQIDELNCEVCVIGCSMIDKCVVLGFVCECLLYEWLGNVCELQECVCFVYDVLGDFIEMLCVGEVSFFVGVVLNGSSVQIKVGMLLFDVEDLLICVMFDVVGGMCYCVVMLFGISLKMLYNKLQWMKVN